MPHGAIAYTTVPVELYTYKTDKYSKRVNNKAISKAQRTSDARTESYPRLAHTIQNTVPSALKRRVTPSTIHDDKIKIRLTAPYRFKNRCSASSTSSPKTQTRSLQTPQRN